MVARSKVTRKGQVTIPIDIRRALELEVGDQVAFEQHGDAVMVRRAQSITDFTAGIFAAYRLPVPLTAEEERAAFEAGVAEENDAMSEP